jgi:hypothetical protein
MLLRKINQFMAIRLIFVLDFSSEINLSQIYPLSPIIVTGDRNDVKSHTAA